MMEKTRNRSKVVKLMCGDLFWRLSNISINVDKHFNASRKWRRKEHSKILR